MGPSFEGLPQAAQELLKGLLNKDPAVRLTAKDCRTQTWCNSGMEEHPVPKGAAVKSIGSSNYFRRAAMFCVATELSMKDMVSVYNIFQDIDEDKSGRLSQEQLAKG